eukprot:COSAG01_NODE_2090_length_8453_cov_554.144721_1_plen_48_part_00
MSHHMGVDPARTHNFPGYVPETAKTASRGGGGKGVGPGYYSNHPLEQ